MPFPARLYAGCFYVQDIVVNDYVILYGIKYKYKIEIMLHFLDECGNCFFKRSIYLLGIDRYAMYKTRNSV